MKNLKKIISVLLIMMLLVGCGNSANTEPEVDANLEFQREYYKNVDEAIECLRDNLKNPSSLQVNAIVVSHDKSGFDAQINIRFASQNNLGAMIDDNFCYFNNDFFYFKSQNGTFDGKAVYAAIKGENSNYPIQIADDFWASSDDLESADFWVFKVDLEDYTIPDQY